MNDPEVRVRRHIPTKAEVFALVIVLLWTLNWFFLAPRLRYFYPKLSLFLDSSLNLLLALAAAYYVWKLVRKVRARLLWKIRSRLILAHIFIGAIPVLIVAGIFCVSGLLSYYQLSYYLISNQIGMHYAQIHAFNLTLRDEVQELMMGVTPPGPSVLKEAIDSGAKYLLASYPSASIILHYSDPVSGRVVTYVDQNRNYSRVGQYQVPDWLGGREFSGLVVEDLQPQIYGRKLMLRSFVTSDFRPDLPFSIEVSVPFDRYLLGRLKATLGQDLLLVDNPSPRFNLVLLDSDVSREKIIASTFSSTRDPQLDGRIWPIRLFPISWASGSETTSDESLRVDLSATQLMGNLFKSENVVGRTILRLLEGTVGFFLLVEVISVVIGILLTKSITNAVHSLDRGTESVKRGDFSRRIVVRSADQLGALAESFNQMTEYVQRLVKERVQKERLERELEIAREVQERLFPDHNPRTGRLEVSGVCLPARVVSGDYYDFLSLGENELGLVIADICGKGISAALLMSSLQATLRSNVLNLWRQDGLKGEKTVARIVERLNNQIYSYTSANRFASFFYGVYDDRNRTLDYCNAGHNPPLLFRGMDFRRLRTGGTVVGVFPDSEYAQETVAMQPGDLLVAYTDGIVESTDEHGEEFGEDRLIQLIRKHRDLDADTMKSALVKEVLSWTCTEERGDDMTVIVAKVADPGRIALE